MQKKNIIVAVDQRNAIGKNNQLLCYLPNDLKHFKALTDGHSIIMGRKTFESLPKGALPNRQNIVITRNKSLQFKDCEVCNSLEESFKICTNEEVFLIGGATIYNEAIDLVDRLYITHIHHEFDCPDTFFPTIDRSIWEETAHENFEADEKNKYAHSFVSYERKKR